MSNLITPKPPECPDCGCQHAPIVGQHSTSKAVFFKHHCRHCGRIFTRKIKKADLKLYGLPEEGVTT